MDELVVIPAYNRVEFLTLCVENILATSDHPRILIVVDNHYDAPPSLEVVQYVDDLSGRSDVDYEILDPHTYVGLSHAIMSGMQLARDSGAEFVYYVEDDVMVSRDFFRWHRAARDLGSWFVSVACKNHCTESEKTLTPDLSSVYSTAYDYTALGACFHRESLGRILKFANSDYWGDTTAFVKRRFPKSKVLPQYSEQAGLIRRIMEEDDSLTSVWPHVPRGYHLGWYGKNCRGLPIPGDTPESRLLNLREIMFDKDTLNALATTHKFIDPVPLNDTKWDTLHLTHHYT